MKRRLPRKNESVRIDPSEELYPCFDHTGQKMFPIPTAEEMGFIVIDNFPEEHIQ